MKVIVNEEVAIATRRPAPVYTGPRHLTMDLP